MLNIGHKKKGEQGFMDYQKAYQVLFNGITDAIIELEKALDKRPEMTRAQTILQSVQLQTEELYIEAE